MKSIKELKKDLENCPENKKRKIYEEIGRQYVRMTPRIDSREKEEIKELFSYFGFNVVLMDASDYSIYEVGIERKSDDFFESIFEGDVFRKLFEIKYNFEYSFFVVDRPLSDIIKEGKKRGLKAHVVYGFVAACMKIGLTPLFLDNDIQMMEIIRRTFEKCYNPKNKRKKRIKKFHEDIKKDILLRFKRSNEWMVDTLLYIFHDDVIKCLQSFYYIDWIKEFDGILKGVNVNKWVQSLERTNK